MEDKPVSVIVTTKNEEKNIENCLKSIKYQTYKNIEIIVVDNASSDETKEIAGKYTDLVFDKGPERSAQRNYGVGVSNGKYIIYIDADMILAPELVCSCVAEIERDGSVAGLYIPEIILGKSFWCKVRRFERSFYDGTVVEAVRFIKKSLFLQVGGFDENISGPEDWDLDRKLSKLGELRLLNNDYYASELNNIPDEWISSFNQLLRDRGIKYSKKYKNALFHNESEFKFLKYLKKKNYYSKSFDSYIKKWGRDDLIIKKQFGIAYRYFWVFIESKKWKRLISRPDMVLGMYILRFMVGVVYLKNKSKNLK